MTPVNTVYERLYAAYGPQHWWPAEGPFEVIVGAILTQNTAWSNVEKAIASLRAADVLSGEGILRLPLPDLATLIRSAGYFRAKARSLQGFVAHLFAQHEGSLEHLFAAETASLRRELLALRGIGPETADSILLYAAAHPIFVVDAYTVRIGSRLGWETERAGYGRWQQLFMDALPRDATLFNEYHALFVRHGKETCRKRSPSCERCPLSDMCRAAGERGVATRDPQLAIMER